MAKLDEKLGHSFIPFGELDPYSENLVCCLFDEATDMDEIEIIKEMKENKLIRSIAIAKTLVYPLERLVFRMFVGKDYSKHIKDAQDLYFKFLRKKISLQEFKKRLVQINGE